MCRFLVTISRPGCRALHGQCNILCRPKLMSLFADSTGIQGKRRDPALKAYPRAVPLHPQTKLRLSSSTSMFPISLALVWRLELASRLTSLFPASKHDIAPGLFLNPVHGLRSRLSGVCVTLAYMFDLGHETRSKQCRRLRHRLLHQPKAGRRAMHIHLDYTRLE